MTPFFFVFLGLHLMAVVVAYGSALVIPFLARGSEGVAALPAWAGVVTDRLALPAAVTMPLSGAAMVVVAGINPTTQAWLWISILLYVGTLAYLIFRQRPRLLRLVRGDRSAELMGQVRRASIGIVAVILVIGAMMMLKPGRS